MANIMVPCGKCNEPVDRKGHHFEVKTLEYQALAKRTPKGTVTCRTASKTYYHSDCVRRCKRCKERPTFRTQAVYCTFCQA